MMMNDVGGLSDRIPEPLENNQEEGEFYFSVDNVYQDPHLDSKRQNTFHSVCSIKGGTSFCKDLKQFDTFYTSPPPDCSSGVCVPRKKISPRDVQNIYHIFISYYGDILFVKLRDNNTHSVYVCKVDSGLLKDNQYLFAIVKRDRFTKGARRKLSSLPWDSFQARKLDKGYVLPSTFLKNNITPVMNSPVRVTSRTDEYSQYTCDSLPIMITLMHKKIGERGQFSDTGKLYLALNEYSTIITF